MMEEVEETNIPLQNEDIGNPPNLSSNKSSISSFSSSSLSSSLKRSNTSRNSKVVPINGITGGQGPEAITQHDDENNTILTAKRKAESEENKDQKWWLVAQTYREKNKFKGFYFDMCSEEEAKDFISPTNVIDLSNRSELNRLLRTLKKKTSYEALWLHVVNGQIVKGCFEKEHFDLQEDENSNDSTSEKSSESSSKDSQKESERKAILMVTVDEKYRRFQTIHTSDTIGKKLFGKRFGDLLFKVVKTRILSLFVTLCPILHFFTIFSIYRASMRESLGDTVASGIRTFCNCTYLLILFVWTMFLNEPIAKACSKQFDVLYVAFCGIASGFCMGKPFGLTSAGIFFFIFGICLGTFLGFSDAAHPYVSNGLPTCFTIITMIGLVLYHGYFDSQAGILQPFDDRPLLSFPLGDEVAVMSWHYVGNFGIWNLGFFATWWVWTKLRYPGYSFFLVAPLQTKSLTNSEYRKVQMSLRRHNRDTLESDRKSSSSNSINEKTIFLWQDMNLIKQNPNESKGKSMAGVGMLRKNPSLRGLIQVKDFIEHPSEIPRKLVIPKRFDALFPKEKMNNNRISRSSLRNLGRTSMKLVKNLETEKLKNLQKQRVMIVEERFAVDHIIGNETVGTWLLGPKLFNKIRRKRKLIAITLIIANAITYPITLIYMFGSSLRESLPDLRFGFTLLLSICLTTSTLHRLIHSRLTIVSLLSREILALYNGYVAVTSMIGFCYIVYGDVRSVLMISIAFYTTHFSIYADAMKASHIASRLLDIAALLALFLLFLCAGQKLEKPLKSTLIEFKFGNAEISFDILSFSLIRFALIVVFQLRKLLVNNGFLVVMGRIRFYRETQTGLERLEEERRANIPVSMFNLPTLTAARQSNVGSFKVG